MKQATLNGLQRMLQELDLLSTAEVDVVYAWAITGGGLNDPVDIADVLQWMIVRNRIKLNG